MALPNSKAGHTQEWWQNRIAYLDRRVCRSGKELQETVTELVEAHKGLVRAAIAAAIVREFMELIKQTPVDTGRARAGWSIGTEPSEWTPPPGVWEEFLANGSIDAAVAKGLTNKKLSEADVIYICNNVQYIMALEAGWSAQAPQGFIGKFLQRLNRQLNQLAAKL
jgi:hypothetical protein|nr:MAG TPA: tail component [Bacteriophage sp.]